MKFENISNSKINSDTNLNFSLVKNIDIDKLLARPYVEGIPASFSEGLFSTYSSGWGFKNGTILATGNADGFGLPIEISIDGKNIYPLESTWMPSHVRSVYDSSKSFDNIEAGDTQKIPRGVIVEENKFITKNDLVASVLSFTNKSKSSVSFKITASPNKGLTEEAFGYRYILFGGDLGNKKDQQFVLEPDKKVEFKLAVSVSDNQGENIKKITAFLKSKPTVKNHIKQFNRWFEKNIPYFDCDDKQILQIYYFRWLTYRNNIRKITDKWNGYIISEFLPNVWWAGLYNSISCPAGHHFYEGRWIRDEKYLNSYQDFWFIDGANPRLYSFPIADAYYNRYLVTGNKQELTKHLNNLCDNYKAWEQSHYLSSIGLFKQIADRDGMENGIGGDGIRSTINSYMYGDAVAIYNIADMLGKSSVANEYKSKAEKLRKNVMEKLWNKNDEFFETLTENGDSVNVRELIGYVPWYFNLPTDDIKYSDAFSQLLDPNGFLAEYGPTTAEQRNPDFMSILRPHCRWDGPSWPFATSQTLVATANLLNNYKNNTSFNKKDWFDLLKTFAKSQYKDGYPWISENIHPLTGEWIVDYDRSIHYNHSSYTDIVITGLVGIRPDDNDNYLIINPLLDSNNLKYFMLENLNYRNHDLTVIYDFDGSKYGIGAGLFVYLDGKLSSFSKALASIRVSLE